jgi:hypothetical protein
MSKKKILLLSDDLRMHSGIATMSRELVLGTVHHYDWVQIAGAIKHPEANKVVDLSQATRDMVKVPDAYVKLYPTDGYGNDQMLFAVMQAENQMQLCILQILDFGDGYMQLKNKLDPKYH